MSDSSQSPSQLRTRTLKGFEIEVGMVLVGLPAQPAPQVVISAPKPIEIAGTELYRGSTFLGLRPLTAKEAADRTVYADVMLIEDRNSTTTSGGEDFTVLEGFTLEPTATPRRVQAGDFSSLPFM